MSAQRSTGAATPRRNISKRNLRAVVDGVEGDLRWCWKVLLAMKGRSKDESITGAAFVEYQRRLLTAIQAVERAYRDVKQEEKRLIDRKSTYSRAWFVNRMKQLSVYGRFLKDILGIARALGDGFAWPFYENDRELIAEHFKHQRQLLLPPGTGGLGEAQGLLKLQGLGKQLLIYHGTTTFLRMGDISFIDLERGGRVASIGEIKTQNHGGGKYTIHVALMASEKDQLPFSASSKQAVQSERLDASTEATRQQQARQIGEAMARSRKSDGKGPDVGLWAKFHLAELAAVVAKSDYNRFESLKVSAGLVIGAVRLPKRSLGAGIMGGTANFKVDDVCEGLLERAKEIVCPPMLGACLHIGYIGGGRDELAMMRDGIPILWWEVADDALEQILFGEVLVVTLYNPAFLWERVASRGFEITFEDDGKTPRAVRKEKGVTCELGALDYYRSLVQRCLMTEESVLGMIDASLDQLKSVNGPFPARIELQHRLVRRSASAA